MRYTADFHYFDNIDTPEKAYWLGFIWADGYAETPSGQRRVAIRHKGKDGTWRSLRFAGKPQGMKILRYLYDNSPIYLERKYQKYLSIPYHQ